MQWYYANNDQRLGPVSEAEFNKLVADGVIVSTTLVWNATMTNWMPYAQIAPTSSALAAAATAPAPDTEVCAVSGKRYPKREMIQYEGRWIGAEHRDAFFQRQREGLNALPTEMHYAGFWIRFVAKFIDGIAVWLLNLPVSFLMGFGSMSGPRFDPESPSATAAFVGTMVLMNVISMLIALAYFWFFQSRFEATPGKMALGLKIVRADGSRLTNGRIIGRYFAEKLSGLILLIGYIMAAFDEPEKRSLHDRICDTRVVKK
jgi:uncharacterized RDD family membrane protein YckC